MSDADGKDTASGRTFAVMTTLVQLGPGPHPLGQISDAVGLPNSTVLRILKTGVRKGVIVKGSSRGSYGFDRDAWASAETGVARLPLGADSALAREASRLQRLTAQAVLAYVPVLIDNTHHRLCVHRTYGKRSDYLAAVSRSDGDVRNALECAPLHIDAAGLIILAHLNGSPASSLMRQIRAVGWLVTPSGVPNWSMLGVPLSHAERVTGALVMVGHTDQISQHQETFAQAAQSAATRLSQLSTSAGQVAPAA